MATQIILFGVGRTDWDDERRIQGNLRVPLNDAGRDEVRARVDELRDAAPAALYTAETLSAVQTAEILAKGLKLAARAQPALNEVGFGLWQGLLVEEVKNRHPKVFKRWLSDPPSVSPPEGEPFEDAFARVANAIGGIAKRHAKETVVVVCPKSVRVMAQCVLTDQAVDRLWDEPGAHAAWEAFQVQA